MGNEDEGNTAFELAWLFRTCSELVQAWRLALGYNYEANSYYFNVAAHVAMSLRLEFRPRRTPQALEKIAVRGT